MATYWHEIIRLTALPFGASFDRPTASDMIILNQTNRSAKKHVG